MSEPNNMKDDPRSAPESGEQKDSGRNRGQVVGGESQLEEREQEKASDSNQHWDSGRQDAAPRSGS
jgi:hypothetical protein